MPNPKRRHSKQRTAKRRSHDFLTPTGTSECPNCHERKLPHRACKKCGDTLKRDVNHICKGKAEPLNLGTVDDITGDGGYITTKDGYRVRGL